MNKVIFAVVGILAIILLTMMIIDKEQSPLEKLGNDIEDTVQDVTN